MKFAAVMITGAQAATLVEIAAEVNAMATTWTAQAPEKFRDTDDVKSYLGAFLPGDPEYTEDPVRNIRTEFMLPTDFDSATNWPQCTVIKNVRDQSSCGSCWAFGSVSSFEARACISTGKDVKYSPEQTAFCFNSDGCQGGNSVWSSFKSTGVVSGGDYGDEQGKTCSRYSLKACAHHVPADDKYPACPSAEYNSPKCPKACESGYGTDFAADKLHASSTFSVRGEQQIMQELFTNGPLYVAFTVYADFPTYRTGIYKHVTGSQLGGHAVTMVGFGVLNGANHWKVKNSWNENWGDNGHFLISRGNNECGIESSVGGGLIGAQPSPSPSPSPGCEDIEESSYCDFVVSQDFCSLIGADCQNSCECCDDVSACGGGDEALRAKIRADMSVQV